jgi:hypothetical protein
LALPERHPYRGCLQAALTCFPPGAGRKRDSGTDAGRWGDPRCADGAVRFPPMTNGSRMDHHHELAYPCLLPERMSMTALGNELLTERRNLRAKNVYW